MPSTSLMMRLLILREQVVRQARPVGGHRVCRGDRADDDRVAVGALVAHDADRADVGQHREVLPHLAVRCPTRRSPRARSRRRARSSLELLVRDVADDAHGEARTRERLAVHDLVGQAELGADGADLVLEERLERLDEVEVHALGERDEVVVALDLGGRLVAASR